jgi:uncharacterized protein (DUF1800 family)
MLKKYVPDESNPYDYSKASHLLRRCLIGVKKNEINYSVNIGLEQTLDELLSNFSQSIDHISEWADKDCQNAAPTDVEEYFVWFWAHSRRVQMFYQWWLMNIRDSKFSIQERMVLFWHNHFAADIRLNIQFASFLYTHYRMLQRNSLGNFKEFVRDTSRDLGIQLNLSQHFNYVHYDKKYINENYARELLELHTVGIYDDEGNRNYTQRDVFEAARSLTGWFYEHASYSEKYWTNQSRWIENRWDSGEKYFLGKVGNWKTDDIINILFEERDKQIAIRICKKIYTFFVTDEPDMNVVSDMATELLKENWEIKPILRLLLSSEHFFEKANYAIIKKSHIEYIMGMIRQFNIYNVPDFYKSQDRHGDIVIRLEGLGQLMFNPPNVSGWTGQRDWVNSSVLPKRLKFAIDVVKGELLTISNPIPPAIYNYSIRDFLLGFENYNKPKELVKEIAFLLLSDQVSEFNIEEFQKIIMQDFKEEVWDLDDISQKVENRTMNFLVKLVQHPLYQLI